VGRQEAMESRRRTAWKKVLKPAYIDIYIYIYTVKPVLSGPCIKRNLS
jgi:hypothetical protein